MPARVAPPLLPPRPLPPIIVPSPTPRDAGRSARRIELYAGAGALIVGGVAIALGVVFANDAQSDADQVAAMSRGGPWTPAQAALDDEGRSRAQLATMLLVGGGAVAVTGGVLCALGLRHPHDLAIVPTRGGGALVWTWRTP
jgi:hypothetical protein